MRASLVALSLLAFAWASTTSTQAQQVASSAHVAGADRTRQGGETWATFKRVDVAEQRSSTDVRVALRGSAERTAGSSAVLGSATQSSDDPYGCYSQALGAVDGALTLLRVCPGRGGYDGGTAAEAFGISVLRLADPATGEPLPTVTPAGGAEMIVVDPRVLAERAAAALRLPAPTIRMSPSGDQVAQLPSWLWIESGGWGPRQVSASAGPVTSTVTARPVQVLWDMGNGDRVTCDGPGRPYAPQFAGRPEATDCRYTYRDSSAPQPGAVFQVTATVDWRLSWSATGAPGGGGLGPVSRSATQAVRVSEVQALVQ